MCNRLRSPSNDPRIYAVFSLMLLGVLEEQIVLHAKHVRLQQQLGCWVMHAFNAATYQVTLTTT